MKKKIYILLPVLVLWIVLTSLVIPPRRVDIPEKKIGRAIAKIWKVENFEVVDNDDGGKKNCFSEGNWLKVKTADGELGMIYVGRVNSCRQGGCSVDGEGEETVSYEFFDYFMLTDMSGEVRWVKIFNYQATQGHEVMSRGWLNQFRGLTSESKKLELGRDIEAISGATISAKAITDDIQLVLQCFPAE